MSKGSESILSRINAPSDLKSLSEEELKQVSAELRKFIIDVVSKNPGHVGANLGVIELTVALHYVFNTPYDKLVWDVGHQAYAHKILTGRRNKFHLNRTYDGISGFPKISESEYDAFGTGHSSTSISAALGMAVASSLLEDNGRQHIAVIGDGAMTAGMAMEALNNAGVANSNILVILNDNGIAIDKNVGALREYLAHITASRTYNRFKDFVWKIMGGDKQYGKNSRALVKQIGNAVKSSLLDKSNLFEAFNFRYFGPVDGHDISSLVKIMNDLKNIPGPKLLHCVTKKGKGFDMAEKEQTRFHAPGLFDKNTGAEVKKKECDGKMPPKYQTVFGKTILELARNNQKIVGITPAMPTGCSLNIMMHHFPERVFDVGIAEQHAVTFSAGMAVQGLVPFCNIYSSFMQRAYDQVIHDVALQNLDVVLCLDRGGLVGEDGATHHGAYDLAYFRSIPNMTIAAPMNEQELRNMMYTAQLGGKGPFVIRYPRGRGVMPEWQTPFEEYKIGKGKVIHKGAGAAVITIGHPGNFALEAAKKLSEENVGVTVYNMRFLKPIDEELLHHAFKNFENIITVEDGTVVGGLGSAVLEFMMDNGYKATVKRLGIPDEFVEQGTPDQLHRKCGFDAQSIADTVKMMLI
ncbi:MAG TPA: 1-deoxy-D-xylulose-5-phosphate synthase [Bacteroidales bacterium]|nr:1-deoxy-D-xylulose-5-phosphate synthase [Bacteroidales bacterium]